MTVKATSDKILQYDTLAIYDEISASSLINIFLSVVAYAFETFKVTVDVSPTSSDGATKSSINKFEYGTTYNVQVETSDNIFPLASTTSLTLYVNVILPYEVVAFTFRTISLLIIRLSIAHHF